MRQLFSSFPAHRRLKMAAPRESLLLVDHDGTSWCPKGWPERPQPALQSLGRDHCLPTPASFKTYSNRHQNARNAPETFLSSWATKALWFKALIHSLTFSIWRSNFANFRPSPNSIYRKNRPSNRSWLPYPMPQLLKHPLDDPKVATTGLEWPITGHDIPTKTRSIFFDFSATSCSPTAQPCPQHMLDHSPRIPHGRKPRSATCKLLVSHGSSHFCIFAYLHFCPLTLTYCSLPLFLKPLIFLSFPLRLSCSKILISFPKTPKNCPFNLSRAILRNYT